MKKLLTLTLAITSLAASAQTILTQATLPDTLIVLSITDEMSDKTSYIVSKNVICSNQEMTKGFSLSAFIEPNLIIRDLKVSIVGLGNCVEKNEMIIMFDDDTKITLKSWNDFNCKGNAWFLVGKKEIDLLATKKLKKIRITNGSTYESYTSDVEGKHQSYFISLFRMLNTKQVFEFKK